MKKLTVVMSSLMLALSLVLIGCVKKEEAPKPVQTETPAPAPIKAEVPVTTPEKKESRAPEKKTAPEKKAAPEKKPAGGY